MLADQPSRRFSRAQRLLNPSDFKYVFDRPVKVSNAYLTILARKNDRPQARLGLAVPKRQIKTAVARNRIKRLIRESFRHHQTELAGLDIVVLVRSGASRVENAVLTSDLNRQWDKLKAKCEKSSSS